jgi:hypothetical protein
VHPALVHPASETCAELATANRCQRGVLVGHLAVGLAAKRIAPRLSLGTLVLAPLAADFLWTLFMLAGIEHVQFIPGRMGAANYLVASDIAYSHSLATNVMWGAVFAAAYASSRRRTDAAWLLFAAVLSHWPLDVISHTPDMPIAPGMPQRFGLGLWASVPATMIVEGGAWAAAIILYARTTRSRGRLGTYAFWIGVALLTLIWRNNVAGPPPPNPRTAPIASLVLFSLIVAWAYWIDRRRESMSDTP